ncbi:MAG: SDR family oxidoreductase [Sediminicola sp.]
MKKNILITGGSSGIGKGIADYFYHKGWNVLVTGRDKDKLSAIKLELPKVYTLYYNSLEERGISDIVDFIAGEWDSKLHVLVNGAGHVELGDLKNIQKESLVKMYQAHLIGPTLLTSKCIDFLEAVKGQILNITSSHGIKVYPQTSAYGSAKAGLNMLTKIWALELAPLGISVNALAPGPTDTGILKSAGYTDESIQKIHASEKAAIPLKRRGEVADIVSKAILLLDAGSNWTTGVILPVDGGISIS